MKPKAGAPTDRSIALKYEMDRASIPTVWWRRRRTVAVAAGTAVLAMVVIADRLLFGAPAHALDDYADAVVKHWNFSLQMSGSTG